MKNETLSLIHAKKNKPLGDSDLKIQLCKFWNL